MLAMQSTAAIVMPTVHASDAIRNVRRAAARVQGLKDVGRAGTLTQTGRAPRVARQTISKISWDATRATLSAQTDASARWRRTAWAAQTGGANWASAVLLATWINRLP